jgi:hypothetical protein
MQKWLQIYRMLYMLCLLYLPPTSTLISCLVYSSTLKMEAISLSETCDDFQRTKCVISGNLLCFTWSIIIGKLLNMCPLVFRYILNIKLSQWRYTISIKRRKIYESKELHHMWKKYLIYVLHIWWHDNKYILVVINDLRNSGVAWLALLFVFGRSRIQISAQRQAFLAVELLWFSSVSKGKCRESYCLKLCHDRFLPQRFQVCISS